MPFFTRLNRLIKLFFQLLHAVWQMVYGAWKISKLEGSIVTIFGSSRIKSESSYAKKAQELGQKFADAHINVLTGGGPGIMEASSCNITYKGKAKSIGIGVTGIDDRPAKCMSDYFELKYFFARKWLLTEFSLGFVIFPGGFGTLDEMTGVLTQMQTKTLKRVPVVLIGKEYWHSFVTWIETEALKHGAILKEEIAYFYVTDDVEEAFCWVLSKCEIKN